MGIQRPRSFRIVANWSFDVECELSLSDIICSTLKIYINAHRSTRWIKKMHHGYRLLTQGHRHRRFQMLKRHIGKCDKVSRHRRRLVEPGERLFFRVIPGRGSSSGHPVLPQRWRAAQVDGISTSSSCRLCVFRKVIWSSHIPRIEWEHSVWPFHL